MDDPLPLYVRGLNGLDPMIPTVVGTISQISRMPDGTIRAAGLYLGDRETGTRCGAAIQVAGDTLRPELGLDLLGATILDGPSLWAACYIEIT